ncbi:hypothetical protein HK405_004715 [Cladochytrium tenue]|nr:hypothetical protein HK405_004715 [Cladochytrium tenue]
MGFGKPRSGTAAVRKAIARRDRRVETIEVDGAPDDGEGDAGISILPPGVDLPPSTADGGNGSARSRRRRRQQQLLPELAGDGADDGTHADGGGSGGGDDDRYVAALANEPLPRAFAWALRAAAAPPRSGKAAAAGKGGRSKPNSGAGGGVPAAAAVAESVKAKKHAGRNDEAGEESSRSAAAQTKGAKRKRPAGELEQRPGETLREFESRVDAYHRTLVNREARHETSSFARRREQIRALEERRRKKRRHGGDLYDDGESGASRKVPTRGLPEQAQAPPTITARPKLRKPVVVGGGAAVGGGRSGDTAAPSASSVEKKPMAKEPKPTPAGPIGASRLRGLDAAGRRVHDAAREVAVAAYRATRARKLAATAAAAGSAAVGRLRTA